MAEHKGKLPGASPNYTVATYTCVTSELGVKNAESAVTC